MESLAAELERVLDERGVPHSELMFVEKNNNYAFSDGVGVFVKVSVVRNREALNLEVSFLLRFGKIIRSVELLVDEVVPVMGGERFAVFYRFVNVSPVSYDEVVGGRGAGVLANSLREFHCLPAADTSFPSLSFDRLLSRIAWREAHFMESYGSGGLLAEELVRYKSVVSEFISSDWGAEVKESMSNSGKLVVCHGDAHLGNFVHYEGGLLLVDYENVVLAPVEYDLVGLLLLAMNQGDEGLYSSLLACFGDLDMDVLRGMLFAKVLSSSSFVLLSADKVESVELFRKRVDVLERSFYARELLEYPL